jgi:flagellar hook assembly protein FlgD
MLNKMDETKETIILGFYSTDGELLHQSNLSTMGSGTYSGFWDTRDAKGKIIPAGSYICRIQSGAQHINKTFIIMQEKL